MNQSSWSSQGLLQRLMRLSCRKAVARKHCPSSQSAACPQQQVEGGVCTCDHPEFWLVLALDIVGIVVVMSQMASVHFAPFGPSCHIFILVSEFIVQEIGNNLVL